MPTIEETIAFIQKAHFGQVTKGGEPYWTHPLAVMQLLPACATEDERHAALLHDVIEDCGISAIQLLEAGYSHRTVNLVNALSRPEGQDRPSYMEWIRSIAASGDIGLIHIKLADNQHNSDPTRIAALSEDQRGITKRYEKSMNILREALAGIKGVECDTPVSCGRLRVSK